MEGLWGKFKGAIDPNYSWKQEAARIEAEKADSVAGLDLSESFETVEISAEAREVMETAQNERAQLFGDVFQGRMDEFFNDWWEKNKSRVKEKAKEFFNILVRLVPGYGDYKQARQAFKKDTVLAEKIILLGGSVTGILALIFLVKTLAQSDEISFNPADFDFSLNGLENFKNIVVNDANAQVTGGIEVASNVLTKGGIVVSLTKKMLTQAVSELKPRAASLFNSLVNFTAEHLPEAETAMLGSMEQGVNELKSRQLV